MRLEKHKNKAEKRKGGGKYQQFTPKRKKKEKLQRGAAKAPLFMISLGYVPN